MGVQFKIPKNYSVVAILIIKERQALVVYSSVVIDLWIGKSCSQVSRQNIPIIQVLSSFRNLGLSQKSHFWSRDKKSQCKLVCRLSIPNSCISSKTTRTNIRINGEKCYLTETKTWSIVLGVTFYKCYLRRTSPNFTVSLVWDATINDEVLMKDRSKQNHLHDTCRIQSHKGRKETTSHPPPHT